MFIHLSIAVTLFLFFFPHRSFHFRGLQNFENQKRAIEADGPDMVLFLFAIKLIVVFYLIF